MLVKTCNYQSRPKGAFIARIYFGITEPPVNVVIIDDNQVYDLSGNVKYYIDQYLSVWTPLGLIYWGDSETYQGDAQERGCHVIFSNKGLMRKAHKVHIKAIAHEINAIIDNYEYQKK